MCEFGDSVAQARMQIITGQEKYDGLLYTGLGRERG